MNVWPKQKPPSRAGEAWSPEEDKQLQFEHSYGMSVATMAKSHGRSEGAIRARLEKLLGVDVSLVELYSDVAAEPTAPKKTLLLCQWGASSDCLQAGRR